MKKIRRMKKSELKNQRMIDKVVEHRKMKDIIEEINEGDLLNEGGVLNEGDLLNEGGVLNEGGDLLNEGGDLLNEGGEVFNQERNTEEVENSATGGFHMVDMFYGGRFVSMPFFRYKDGKNECLYDINAEKVNLFVIKGWVDKLGYNPDYRMFYLQPGSNLADGLREIITEDDANSFVQHLKYFGLFEIYVEGEIQVRESVEVDELDVNHEDVAIFDSVVDSDFECEVDSESDTEVGSLEDISDDELMEIRKLKLERKGKRNKELVVEDADDIEEKSVEGENNGREDEKMKVHEEGADVAIFDSEVDSDFECEVDSESDTEVGSLDDISDDELMEIRNLKLEIKGKRNNGREDEKMKVHEEGDEKMKGHEEGAENIKVHEEGENTDYADSSECHSAREDDSEEENSMKKPKKTRYPVFDAHKDLFKLDPEIGMRFKDTEELRKCLRAYAIKHGCNIGFPRSSATMLLCVCSNECPWRLWASKMQNEESIQIKSYKKTHTCSRSFELKAASASFMAELYCDRLLINKHWTLRDFKADVCDKYGININLMQLSRIRKRVIGELDKKVVEHYAKVYSYLGELMKVNPGSTFKIKCSSDEGGPARLVRMYVCFEALKTGWRVGCRPIIGIDGTFLKGVCRGQLLTAVSRDGNNQMYPLAWAQVESENKDSWLWFLTLLGEDLDIEQGNGVTFVSDQQKGLVAAVSELFPLAEHRNCARHIYSNMWKNYRGVHLKKWFWQASFSTTPQEFEKVMAVLKESSDGAYKYVMDQNPMVWSRAYFSTHSTCEAVENNMCEIFKNCIREARSKNIICMLEDLRVYMMARLSRRKGELEACKDVLCPKIREKLEKNKLEHRFWMSTLSGGSSFEVRKGMEAYVVDLRRRTCFCRRWMLCGIPCPHAISSIYFKKENPDNYVSEYLTVEGCKKAYMGGIPPLNGEMMWEQSPLPALLPPIERRLPGRPKKLRKKATHESKMQHEISRTGRAMRCSKCKEEGHNRTSCKVDAPTTGKKASLSGGKSTSAGKSSARSHRKTPTEKLKKNGEKSQPVTPIVKQPVTRSSKRKNIEQAPEGYGSYISPKTGNQFVKLPGQKRGKWQSPNVVQTQQSQTSGSGPSTRSRSSITAPGVSTAPGVRTRQKLQKLHLE